MSLSTVVNTKDESVNSKKIILLLPTLGILMFFLMYIISTVYYPGGSYYDRSADGFSWMHNYWCNLMGNEALNGEPNTARYPAIIGTQFLCFGVGIFYYIFPNQFEIRKLWRIVIRIVGVLSMVFAAFLYTDQHDTVLNVAGVFGGIAFIGTLTALNRNGSYLLLWLGVFGMLMITINNYMYYTRVLHEYLPLFQKVTLILVLSWFIAVNQTFVKTNNH
jgi:hypothetical protein